LASPRIQLKELQIRPKKSLGQHFLHDPNILRKIVEAASLNREDVVLEIGGGLGSLTRHLADRAKKVYVLEIDPRLARALQERFSAVKQVKVILGDALQVDLDPLFEKERRKMKVVANLPYEISSPMIFRLLQEKDYFSLLVIMLQLEVARRVVAQPGTRDYGPLGLWSQLYSRVTILFQVGPQVFHPPPKVDSAVVRFEILPQPSQEVEDETTLQEVIRAAFTYRRKTLGKALQLGGFPVSKITRAMEACSIPPLTRGETLTLKQFCNLARFLTSQ
jgi:16S rRNA (adenine1518-N6/adenine1519-N6)-dimethyltransferase